VKVTQDNLREKREMKGISQEKLAVMIGVSRQTVFNWENSKTTPSKATLLLLNEILQDEDG
jgi:transcriptional regulator with XRE-family HTH domain